MWVWAHLGFRTAISLAFCGLAAVPALAVNRTIDGTGNNIQRPNQGAANTNIIRFGYPGDYPDGYGDQIYSTTTTPARPNARTVSNTLSTQTTSVSNNRNLSDWVVQWGQFLTHDMDLTTTSAANNTLFTGGTGNFNIPITDLNDPMGRTRFHLTAQTTMPTPARRRRSPWVRAGLPATTRPNWREQINSITSYIDASNVYGSTRRAPTRCAPSPTESSSPALTDFCPASIRSGLANDDPLGLGSQLFLAGDVRANEQVGLTATHALFTREHNRLATLIKSNNPAMPTSRSIRRHARSSARRCRPSPTKNFSPRSWDRLPRIRTHLRTTHRLTHRSRTRFDGILPLRPFHAVIEHPSDR
jgi:hypothetical protein